MSRETDPRSPELNQYGFVQSLIREVVYNTLARRDRKVRHLAAARFLEGMETDELAGALAGQYLAAHANADGPDETAALAAQARVALRAAADRAAGLGSPDQAFEFLRDALALAVDPADEVELSLRAGEAATSGGRYADSEPLLRRALDMSTSSGDANGADRAVTALATNLIEGARFTEAIQLLEPILARVDDYADRPELVAAGGQLARAHMLQQDADRAISATDRVLPAAEIGNFGPLVADILITKGTALIMARRTQEGLALITSGGDLGEALGATKVTTRALVNQSFALAWMSQREAYANARKGLVLARRLGHRGFELNLVLNSVYAGLHAGEWDWAAAEAENTLDKDLDAIDRLAAVVVVVTIRALRGEPREDLLTELRASENSELQVTQELERAQAMDELARGRLTEASARLERNRTLAGDIDDYLWTARIAAWRGDAPALSSALEALQTSGRHGDMAVGLELEIRGGMAALQAAPDEAIRKFKEARDVWRRMDLPWDQALLGLDMASVLDPTLPAVEEAIGQSRAILTRLGARPFLERLESVVGTAPSTGTSAADAVPVTEAEVPIS